MNKSAVKCIREGQHEEREKGAQKRVRVSWAKDRSDSCSMTHGRNLNMAARHDLQIVKLITFTLCTLR